MVYYTNLYEGNKRTVNIMKVKRHENNGDLEGIIYMDFPKGF